MKRTVVAIACAAAVAACVTQKSVETVVSGTMVKVNPKTTRGTFASPQGSRDYLAYRPATFPVKPDERALVVMLHGCMQTADDFAKGTRMNSVADSGAFMVLYPEQSATAQAQQCWNWYTPQQYLRGQGEAAILMALIDSVTKADGITAQHVSIAGLAAGAAMAANLVVAYPEKFAALAMHSGVAALAATDQASASSAMKLAPSNVDALGTRAIAAMGAHAKPIPIILFQGASDTTVVPANMDAIARQFMVINANANANMAPVETHLLPGVGHAWSGGATEGTFTAPDGPNASVMIATFLRKVGAIL